MAPLLLYAPPIFSISAVPMKLIAGLTVTQDLVGSMVAAITHRRYKFLRQDLILHMGSWIGISSLIGGVLSHWAPGSYIFALLVLFVTVAAGSMVLTQGRLDPIDDGSVRFSRKKAAAISTAIGLLAGLIGQGSAFILIPAMLLILKLPVRVTVSNALGIVFCAALGGFLGKWGTNQISLSWLVVFLVVAVPSSHLGAAVGHRVSSRAVRALLTTVLLVVAAQMWHILLSTTVK